MRPASISPTPAPCSLLPTMRISASSGCSSALRTTSGPIPRGSPNVTARRTTALEADVDVRLVAPLVDVMPDGEVVTEDVFNPQLHVLESQLPFGVALRHLEHDELGAGGARTPPDDPP